MMKETIWRARTLVKRGEVKLIDKRPPFFHFQVRQRSGEWTDVWYDNGLWNCNSVAEKETKLNKETGKMEIKSWGCVMNVHSDKTQPYCSHTLSCKILLDKLGGKMDEKDTLE